MLLIKYLKFYNLFFRYTYIVSNEDAFVSARGGYLCKLNIVCFS